MTNADAWLRLARPFVPPTVTLKQIHDAVPKHLLRRDPLRSTGYVVRDVFFCALFFAFGAAIEPLVSSHFAGFVPLTSPWQATLARSLLWLTYWWWQGIVFTSFFCIGEPISQTSTLRTKMLITRTWVRAHHSA